MDNTSSKSATTIPVINYDKPTYYLNILFLLTHCFPINKILKMGAKPTKSELSVKLRNSTINFLLLKLNQWLKIFYRVVFTHRLLNSSIFVSVGTLMDGMMKKT